MKLVFVLFASIHALIATLFALASLVLITTAAYIGWDTVAHGINGSAAQRIIEAIGLLAAGVVALQMAQTIVEEEVVRHSHVSAPTRVRRFLSRFFVVVLVALAIEGLVATFKAVHENLGFLVYSACALAATAAMLAALGVFVRLNVSAEELEPEAMEAAKREDKKVQ